MAITVLTETQAAAQEYFYDTMAKIKEILVANGAVLKAGDRAVDDRVYYGASVRVAQFPAILIEPLTDEERYGTFSTNELTFSVHIWVLNEWLDTEENEQAIHQLGDRAKAVLRANDTLDGLCRQCIPRSTSYGRIRLGTGAFLRAGEIVLEVQKEIDRPGI